MKKNQLFSAALVSLAAVVAVAPSANANFTDVPAKHPFSDAINDLTDYNIITGFEDGTFRPNDTLTREQAAIIIARALDLNLDDQPELAFKDVPKTTFGYNHIAALYNAGIISGVSPTEFKPYETVTRGQMAKMLVNGFLIFTDINEKVPFTDVANTYAEKEIHALYHSGITKGVSPTEFGFNEKITRGQIAQFVYNIKKYYDSFYEINASEFGYEFVHVERFEHVSDGAIELKAYKNDNDKIKYLTPLREGTDYLLIAEYLPNAEEPFTEKFKYFRSDVTTVDGNLKVSLTELNEPIFHLIGLDITDIVDLVITDLDGNPLADDDYVVVVNDDGTSIVYILKGEGDYMYYAKYNDGDEYVFGLKIRHEAPYTFNMFGEYYDDVVTIDTEIAEQLGFDLSSVTEVKTSVYDEDKFEYTYGDNIISYEISSNEFKFKPLVDGSLSMEFYDGDKYLGELNVVTMNHGKGFIIRK